VEIRQEQSDDWWEVEALYDLCFAPGREALSSYRLRDEVAPVAALSRVARDADGVLGGVIRYWPVRIGDAQSLLLGPIAVHPTRQGEGLGSALMTDSLQIAKALGWTRVLLVGDGTACRVGLKNTTTSAKLEGGGADMTQTILPPVKAAHPSKEVQLAQLVTRYKSARGVGMQVVGLLGSQAENLLDKLPAPARDGLDKATLQALRRRDARLHSGHRQLDDTHGHRHHGCRGRFWRFNHRAGRVAAHHHRHPARHSRHRGRAWV